MLNVKGPQGSQTPYWFCTDLKMGRKVNYGMGESFSFFFINVAVGQTGRWDKRP